MRSSSRSHKSEISLGMKKPIHQCVCVGGLDRTGSEKGNCLFVSYFSSASSSSLSIDMALWITYKKNNLALCHNLFFYIDTHNTSLSLSLSLSALLKRSLRDLYSNPLLAPSRRSTWRNKYQNGSKEENSSKKKKKKMFLSGDWREISNRLREMCVCVYIHTPLDDLLPWLNFDLL
jgi:hypothetical protein